MSVFTCSRCGEQKDSGMLFCYDCTAHFNEKNNDLRIITLENLQNLSVACFQYRFDETCSNLLVHVSCHDQYRGILVSDCFEQLTFTSKDMAIKYLECCGFFMAFNGMVGLRND